MIQYSLYMQFSLIDLTKNQETKRAAKVEILSISTKFAALNYT